MGIKSHRFDGGETCPTEDGKCPLCKMMNLERLPTLENVPQPETADAQPTDQAKPEPSEKCP